jgi:hypothetical protein
VLISSLPLSCYYWLKRKGQKRVAEVLHPCWRAILFLQRQRDTIVGLLFRTFTLMAASFVLDFCFHGSRYFQVLCFIITDLIATSFGWYLQARILRLKVGEDSGYDLCQSIFPMKKSQCKRHSRLILVRVADWSIKLERIITMPRYPTNQIISFVYY